MISSLCFVCVPVLQLIHIAALQTVMCNEKSSEFMLQWLTSKSDGMSLANSRSKHCKIISAAKYVICICMRNYVMHNSRMSARARTCSARSCSTRSSVFETTPIT